MSILFIISYTQDLIDDLKSELGGHLKEVVLSLMTKPVNYDAKELKAAIKVGL